MDQIRLNPQIETFFRSTKAGAFCYRHVDLFLIWSLLTLVNLGFHRLIPLDETRYAAVAWDMWVNDHYLVPHLNGVPYHHKPPLLFWIYLLGWKLFGVNDEWLLLVSPLCALFALYMVRYLSGLLWPGNRQAARKAPWLLLGSLVWGAYMNSTMFDMLLGLCVLLAMIGLVKASFFHSWRYWSLFALGTGFGLLAKGPVVLMHILGPWLFGIYWSKSAKQHPGKWYMSGSLALVVGIAIGLAWAIPAAKAGGGSFGGALLWHQTADRVVRSFAHRRPIWWYLELAPVILFPWCFWPRFWKSIANGILWNEPAFRICAIWFLVGLFGFSLVSGKQVHYLLPLMPALALAMGRALSAKAPSDLRIGDFLPFIVICLFGIGLLVLPLFPDIKTYHWVENRLLGWPIAIIATGITGIVLKTKTRRLTPYSLSASIIILLMASIAGFFTSTGNAFHLNGATRQLEQFLKAGDPIAWAGKYDGQFLFLLRLEKPMPVIEFTGIRQWLKEHPNGHVVFISANPQPSANRDKSLQTDYLQPYREDWLLIQSLGSGPRSR